MSTQILTILISLTGVVLSLLGSAFIAGIRVGKLESKIDGAVKDIAEIRGMFTLTLRKPDDG